MEEEKKMEINLTGRPPVRIDAEGWPEIASSRYHDYEGPYDFQSNRHWKGYIRVRQHADGRAIVYARCCHDTSHAVERDYDLHAGELLPVASSTEMIVQAVRRVHASIDTDHVAWRTLDAECIADLPAEEI